MALVATVALLGRSTFLLWQGSVVRLGDFGWFWWPLHLLEEAGSPWRMHLAWTRQPHYVDGLLALGLRALEVLLAHLPILAALGLLFVLVRRAGVTAQRGLRLVSCLFVLPDLALGGFELAVRFGIGGWQRDAFLLLVAAVGLTLVWLLLVAAAGLLLGSPGWVLVGGGAVVAALALPVIDASGASLRAARGDERPNILLISIDSLRADHLGCYGYPRPTSPSIDRLAAEGARFEVAVAPSPWTLPSHLTLLTGLPPRVHGVVDSDLRLDGAAETLAERLDAEGYRTAAIVSGYFLDSSYGYSQGFDSYDDFSLNLLMQDVSPESRVAGPAIEELVERHADRWRRPEGHGAPFFLFLHLYDVHFDYIPPPPFDARFARGIELDISDYAHNDRVRPGMPEEELVYVVSQYDGEIAATDRLVGPVVSSLERLGVLDQTIVVLTSDHGQEFFEHGNKGHRSSLFEEQVRVPLVMRYPERIAAGLVVPEVVGLQDVGATILGLAGIRRPFGLERTGAVRGARDLSSRLSRGISGDPARSAGAVFGSLHRDLYSARSSRFKLVVDRRDGSTREALYRLDVDPRERTNAIAEHPEEAARLRTALEEYLELGREGGMGVERGLSGGLEHGLRALGYLD